MKKIVCTVAIALCLVFGNQLTASASDGGAASMVGTVGVATVMGAENMYEASVIKRMVGRAGAALEKGAKGISFEIMYCDAQNLFHNLTNGCKTMLSASSTDPVADIITIDKERNVIKGFQLKDGTSTTHINNVINQSSSGKYAEVEIVGTKEFAASYNPKAAVKGAQMATDSGISTKKTSKLANMALGIAPSGAELLEATAKNSALAAAGVGAVSLAESVYSGKDVYETAGSFIEDTSATAITVALATVTSAELPALLTSLGVSAAVASNAASVAAIIVPLVGGAIIFYVADQCEVEENIAVVMEEIIASLSDTYHSLEAKLVSSNIPDKAAAAYVTVGDTANELASTVTAWFNSVAE